MRAIGDERGDARRTTLASPRGDRDIVALRLYADQQPQDVRRARRKPLGDSDEVVADRRVAAKSNQQRSQRTGAGRDMGCFDELLQSQRSEGVSVEGLRRSGTAGEGGDSGLAGEIIRVGEKLSCGAERRHGATLAHVAWKSATTPLRPSAFLPGAPLRRGGGLRDRRLGAPRTT